MKEFKSMTMSTEGCGAGSGRGSARWRTMSVSALYAAVSALRPSAVPENLVRGVEVGAELSDSSGVHTQLFPQSSDMEDEFPSTGVYVAPTEGGEVPVNTMLRSE